MAFHGLFIGIDRYSSPAIQELTAAARDARALHALFTDNFGIGAELLVDAQATRSAIAGHFTDLARSDPDDVVVIGFSGHGSPTHELVTYDADLLALSSTAIPLDLLADWFSHIPAHRLICLLDCCFSGGMGAKVLVLDHIPRTLESVEVSLTRLSGQGRLIVTASLATEEAFEHRKIRHGLLTYYVLEALQGAEEVRREGAISVYQLADFVTKQVASAADRFGKPQHPAVRGTVDGGFTWPVFRRGPAYEAAFPGSVRLPATSDIASLRDHGFPQAFVAAWSVAIPTLNDLQLSAINDGGVLAGDHLLVSAPTSSGKTMIGELAALKNVLERERTIFLLPLRALVNEKFAQFQRVYEPLGLRIIRSTGEISDDNRDLMLGRYDICLLTYEHYAALVLGLPHLLAQAATIVVDEVQTIVDPSRGANLEFLLTLIRMRRNQGIEPQVIALSAVVGDTNGLDRWLGAHLLRRTERPVPLCEGVLGGDGSYRYLAPDGRECVSPWVQRVVRKGGDQEYVIPLVRRLVAAGMQVIVFRETRGETRGCANYLAETLNLPPARSALDRLPSGDPSGSSAALRLALQQGVGFHNADLDREERQILEEEFRRSDSTLRVLAATTTLAMGINTPAGAVVIVGLQHPGSAGNSSPYTVAEYKNIVGRAGRLGQTDHGESYIVAPFGADAYTAWSHYVCGVLEDVKSRFLDAGTDVRTLILRVLSTAGRTTRQGLAAADIMTFLEGSFGAFQRRLDDPRWHWEVDHVQRALDQLAQHDLLTLDPEQRYVPTALGRLAGEGGAEVESIIRLAAALRSLQPDALTAATLIAAAQITVELDDVYFPINTKSTIQEPPFWVGELRKVAVPEALLGALRQYADSQHVATRRAKRAVSCLYWTSHHPLQMIESTLMHFDRNKDVAGPIRAVADRTRDLLPTVARVAEYFHPDLHLGVPQRRLAVQLEIGLPEAAVPLAELLGRTLTRADYLALLQANIADPETLADVDDATLLPLLEGRRNKLSAIRDALVLPSAEPAGPPVSLLPEPAY